MKENNDLPEEALPESSNTPTAAPPPKKRLKLFILLFILLIIACLGGYFWYKKSHIPLPPAPVAQMDNENIFYKLDDIIVNLNSAEAQSRFLKVGITLQLTNKDTILKLDNSLPIIKDLIQSYLRELRPQDLNGSAGLYRIKDELLLRLNEVMAPNKITDVLFRDILVQ